MKYNRIAFWESGKSVDLMAQNHLNGVRTFPDRIVDFYNSATEMVAGLWRSYLILTRPFDSITLI